MTDWEKRNIADVLIDHHKALMARALELGGSHEGFAKTEWDAIVIEHYLGTDHGLEWDGEKFQKGENPYTVDKYCPATVAKEVSK